MGADVGEPRLDFGDPVRVVRGLRFRQQARAFDVGGEHDVDQAFRAVGRLLRKPPDAPARRQLNAPCSAAMIARDYAEQRGLAAAVAPHQPDPGTGRNARRRLVDQKPAGNADGKVVDVEHGRAL